MKSTFFTRYNLPVSQAVVVGDYSLTVQDFAEDVKLDNILKRYLAGEPCMQNTAPKLYADISNFTDYMDAVDQINEFHGFFDDLPSAFRDKYQNDVDVFAKEFFKDPLIVDKYYKELNNPPPLSEDNVVDENT